MTKKNPAEQLSMDAHLEAIAVSHNVTTIMLPAPNGGYMVYVSPREKDVTRAIMSALIDIKMRRAELGEENDTVKIRPVNISSPGNAYYYELRAIDGGILTSGYAATEQIAREKMMDWSKANGR